MTTYFKHDNIIIRSMIHDDISKFPVAFDEQNWNKPLEQFEAYFEKQSNNEVYVLVAAIDDNVAGYTLLYPKAISAAFAHLEIPEIVDFNVLEKYQKHGIGNKLLDVAEDIARKLNNRVGLGVGLHSGYGPAQRIYVKRGYIPNGDGVWYKDKILEPHEKCCNDNELVLYLSKSLTNQEIRYC